MKTNTILPMEIIRILPKAALARKYNCSAQYVRKVLQGQSRSNSPRAQGIINDANDISAVILRKTVINSSLWDYSANLELE